MCNASNPFEKYFHIEEVKVDLGVLVIEEGQRHKLAKAFFDLNLAVDQDHRRDVEIVDLRRPKSVILPKSVRNRSKVVYAGNKPVFASLDKFDNLITYMVVGCVIRVEYLGMRGAEKKIKYFRCL